MSERTHNRLNATSVAPLTPAPSGALQRKCACGNHTSGGECEACSKKHEGILQRKAADSAGVNETPPIVSEALNSPGQPLDSETRAFFERRFGRDFSNVRIHNDAKADESARAVNALAYTVGRDVVFGSGQYSPRSNAGRQLIAHELTHVLQQSNGTISNRAILGGMGVSNPNDSFEQQADETASRIFSRATSGAGADPLRLSSLMRLIQLFARPPAGAGASGLIDAVSRRVRAVARNLAASSSQRLHAMAESDDGRIEPHDPMAIRAQLGSGQLFDGPIRNQMERSFGVSFSSVRIHNDATATRLNAELGARAFTIGADIAFAAGQYRPGTLPGDALIAHELAHTLQQNTDRLSAHNGAPDSARRRAD